MLDLKNLQKGLDTFATQVVKDAKSNLVSRKKIASGKLINSLKAQDVIVRERSLEIGIRMMFYGAFVDKGVSGVNVKYNTPYSYTNKMLPPSALDGWIVKKGIAPRDENGKFIPRKSIQFAIARSIFLNGIKPSNFLTDAVKTNVALMPKQLQKAFALDVQTTIDLVIKSNFKK